MNRFEVDSAALKAPALVTLVTLLAAAALVWLSQAHVATHQRALQQARDELNGIRADYTQAVEAGTIIRNSSQRYAQLARHGFIGDEPRLVWIEALRAGGQKHHLYQLLYNLKQRQPLQLAGDESSTHYQLYGSFMHLELELAHEVDLLRYFAELETGGAAVWQLHGCTVSSAVHNGKIVFDKANVKASCDLAWYTIKSLTELSEAEGEQL